MSMYFRTGEIELWNPGNLSGVLFVSLAECVSQIVHTPTGLHVHDGDPDAYVVDTDQFRIFTDALRNPYVKTGSSVPRSLLDGLLAVCLVISDRAGMPLEMSPMEQWGMDARVEELGRSM